LSRAWGLRRYRASVIANIDGSVTDSLMTGKAQGGIKTVQ